VSILVDTSVWIEWLNGKSRPSQELLESVVVCGPILQEVLQGLKNSPPAKAFKESFLQFPVICDPLPSMIYRQAADLYRQSRQKGYTVRSSIDCLIAAIAIESSIPVVHQDRDFPNISKFSALESKTLADLQKQLK